MNSKHISRHAALSLAALIGVSSALVTSYSLAGTVGSWTGSIDNNWNNSGNWTGGVPLVAGDEADINKDISSATTITLDTSVVLSTLRIGDTGATGASGYILALGTGKTLTLNGNGSNAILQQTNRSAGDTMPAFILASDVDISSLITGAYYFRIAGVISGTGNVNIASTNVGTPYITATNTFVGNMNVNGGTVMVTGDAVFGNTSNGTRVITINNNATIRANGNITLGANRQLVIGTTGGVIELNGKTVSLNNTSQLSGSTPLALNSFALNGVFNLGAANTGYTGTVTIGTNVTLNINSANALTSRIILNGGTLGGSSSISCSSAYDLRSGTVSTGLGGTVGANKTTASTVTLNAAGTFSGATSITAGALQLGHSDALLNSSVTVGVANGLKFSAGLGSANIAGLNGASNFALQDVAVTPAAVNLSIGSTGGSYSGVMSGAGGLTKSGSGTQTLSGTNTYTGATSITGGTLAITGSGSINGTSGITINGGTLQYGSSVGLTQPVSFTGTGGKLVLNGSSSYAGALTITSGNTLGGSGTYSNTVTITGGTLAPGNSPGTITVGSLSMDTNTVLSYDLNATDHTTGSNINDYTVVNGDLVLDGTLNLASPTELTAGTYTLIHYTGSLTDNGLLIGSNFGTAANQQYAISNDALAGNINLVVTVPEPAAISLLGLSAMSLLSFRRRRN